MNTKPRRTRIRLEAAAWVVVVATVVQPVTAQTASQLRQQVVGTWELVSVVLEQDGKKVETFGENPKGLISYDANGNYVYAMARSDLPKLASNNRLAPTQDNAKAIAIGTLAAYGKWSFNDADGDMTMTITSSTFPNVNGTVQKRLITVSGDALRVTNPTPPAGGGTAYVVWKRVR
jgi:hypothetical protein